MKHTPREEQVEAIELALAQVGYSNGCIVGDEPGFGKTTIAAEIALDGIERHGWSRILIIALPNTHKQWKERVEAQMIDRPGPHLPVLVMDGKAKGKDNLKRFLARESGIYIAGSAYLRQKDWGDVPERFRDEEGAYHPRLDENGDPVMKTDQINTYRKAFSNHPMDAVLFDECQEIANRNSRTRRTIYSIYSNFRIALSGTWFLNKIENMWSIANWVWPGKKPGAEERWIDPSFTRWRDRYLVNEIVTDARGLPVYTSQGRVATKSVAEKIPGEFVSTLPAYIRRVNKEQVPAAHRVWVEPTPEQKEQLDDLERDLMTWVKDWDGDRAPLVVDVPVVLRTRMRQVTIAELSLGIDPNSGDEIVTMQDAAASAKLKALRGIIDGPWKGQPVAIYTDSKVGANFIAGRMRWAGYDARVWSGDLTKTQREDLKQAFMRGEFPFLVATIPSFGTGIDGFQKVCSKVIWVSKADGNPSLNEQAIARFFRPGRTLEYGEFEHVELVMRGTVDEVSMDSLIQKAWAMRAAMKG